MYRFVFYANTSLETIKFDIISTDYERAKETAKVKTGLELTNHHLDEVIEVSIRELAGVGTKREQQT